VFNQVSSWLDANFGLAPVTQQRLLASAIAIAVMWLIHRLVLAIAWRRVEAPHLRYRIRKTSTYVIVPIGFLVVGRLWFEGIQSIATFLGLLTAGLAIALKDLIVNLAGWGFILWRRPFDLGDRIEISGHMGDVIDVRIFQFTLMEVGNWVNAEQSTGRVIHIPNGNVLSDVVANYSKGFQFIWNELPVLVTFESNWKKAKKILTEIVERETKDTSDDAQKRIVEASARFLISYSKLTPVVYTEVRDSGVLLTMRYLCSPRSRRGSAQTIWESVLEAFSECDDIDFAYPTQRFYTNTTEGKVGARAEPSPPPSGGKS